MRRRVEDGSMQEYVRGFGLHVGLKFFEPVTSGIKVIGTAWFLRIFIQHYPELNPRGELTLGLLGAFVGTFLHNPLPVILMVNTSVWRTLITLWRMLGSARRHISYKVALVVGMIPAFGSLAYPMQMYWKCPELSTFLIRYVLSLAARGVPIYGGKYTRTEIWLVRFANFPLEAMAILKGMVRVRDDEAAGRRAVEVSPETASAVGSLGAAGDGPSGAPAGESAVGTGAVPRGAGDGDPPTGGEERKRRGRWDALVEESIRRLWERYREEVPDEGY
jgi:hypothetical protein